MDTTPVSNNPVELPIQAGIGEVVVDELKEIARRKGEAVPSLDPEKWIDACHEEELFGVCLSGGGIRSATFGLGVLQGLAEKKLLSRADYISTVSGGGYIGAWLQGVAAREPNYEEVLDPKRKPDLADKDPITFLRKYSNYLAPRNGLSLDAVVIPLIWFRNTMLNQVIIISALMAVYIALLAPGALLRLTALAAPSGWTAAILTAAVILHIVAVFRIGSNLHRIVAREFPDSEVKTTPYAADAQRSPTPTATEGSGPSPAPGSGDATSSSEPQQTIALEQHVGWQIATPLFLSVLLLVFGLSAYQPLMPHKWGFIVGYVVLFSLLVLLQWHGGFLKCYADQRRVIRESFPWWLPPAHIVWMSLVTAAFLLLLVGCVWYLCELWKPAGPLGSQLVVAWAPSLYFLVIIAGIGLHIGLMGRDFPDASREWLARLGALILAYLGIWAALFALAVFAPLGIAQLCVVGRRWLLASGTGAWAMSTIMSVLAGKSSKSGAINPDQQHQQSSTVDLVARYGPFVAIPGFLAVVAFGTQLLLHRTAWTGAGSLLDNFRKHYWDGLPFCGSSLLHAFGLLVFVSAVFLILSRRVNINEFSLHHFYKNRLVRCYLGASATRVTKSHGQEGPNRMPDPFTGFDPRDDLKLFKLRSTEQDKNKDMANKAEAGPTCRVPYPIINAALTVTAGVELATQERKALPWFFTPLYSGFYPARSDDDRDQRGAGSPYANSRFLSQGLNLGTAMAISGAAVNPAMGYHSSPQTAFLLTLFNVRLGWWLGNPTKAAAIRKPGPTVALWWLGRELFGFVDEGSTFINLSDGGHFENLGLYELVRRRCRYIIVVDAEEDPDYRFESLGGAVRKCRADFGVEIDIDPRPITPQAKFGRTHCVVGRIDYDVDKIENGETEAKDIEPGWILYLKSSITGDEPADVEEYRRENPQFPQQSTADQFFSESQFESYRRLGLHVARSAFDHVGPHAAKHLPDLFERLKAQWLLPPAAPEGAAARHSEAYSKLLAELVKNPDLDSAVIERFPPETHASDEERSSFFFHLQLLQFIEAVFLDLDFTNAEKWNHPANEGWRRLITYWATRPNIERVWESQRENYGQPFRDCFDDLVGRRHDVPVDQQH